MRRIKRSGTLLCVLCLMLADGSAIAAETECWKLTFEDEFEEISLWDGKTGIWKTSYIWGNDDPINEEKQYYVDPRSDGINPFILRDGILAIEARPIPEDMNGRWLGREYTSGLLTTEKSFGQQYGRFEIKARLPGGKGLWPAFWMLPSFDQWPEGIELLAEIDVMEFLGQEPPIYYGSLHTNEAGVTRSGTTQLDTGVDLTADFHAYAVQWSPTEIAWYFDGKRMLTLPAPADMHQPFHVLLNLAVAGKWPGDPDERTRFPARYEIDYVRVYEKTCSCTEAEKQ